MAGRGKGALRIAIEDFIESFDFGKILSGWVEKILDNLEDANMGIYRKIVAHFGLGDKLPPSMQPDNLGALVKSSQSGFFLSLFAIVGVVAGGFFGAGAPFQRLSSYYVDTFYRTFRSDPMTLISMMFRNPEKASDYNKYLQDLGVPDDMITSLQTVYRQTLSPVDLERLRLKGKITDAELKDEAYRQGWTDERIEQIKGLVEQIPGAQDLITMAVREAFNPGVVEQFGYAEDYPSEFGSWMEKQGYSEDWAKKYWYSHWNLPSLTQGFEMLHRLRPDITSNPVTSDDIATLLKIQDISPFWRERLMEISYSPLTRVDVRRMFAMGVLDENQVYQNYLDLGYTPENADLMTRFTVRYERNVERGLTRSVIEGSYKRGIISRQDALNQLSEIGYAPEMGDYYLDIIDFDLESQITDLTLDTIHTKYLAGQLDDSTVIDQINRLDMPGERVTAIVDYWRVQKQNKVNNPSRSELDDFYRRGFITDNDYQNYLKLDGYSLDAIDLFTRRIDMIAQEDAEYALAQAQSEQERLKSSRLSSEYQKNKAGLEVGIAEMRAAIADLKVTLHDLTDPDDIADNKRAQDEIKSLIAQVNVAKANLAFSYRSDKLPENEE